MAGCELLALMPPGDRPPGHWWEVQAGQPTGPVADSVITAIRCYGWPAILAGLDADPAAWFVQPTGTSSDSSFAKLTSDMARDRHGAIDSSPMSDPRALPALLDRLERDPLPFIRRWIACQLLLPMTHDPQVRSALRAVAAEDDNLEVRWAARFALRAGPA